MHRERASRFQLDAVFTDLGGDGWEHVPPAVKDEVLRRTPGYAGWQQEQWQAHCEDAMAFLGPAGHQELETFGPDAVIAMREELASWGWRTEHIDEFLQALERDSEPTAYVFRCRHCDAFRAYADFT